MGLIILLVIVTIVAVILGLAATKPDSFRYDRSLVMKAPPEKIHPYLNNFKLGNEWSPWIKKDPNIKLKYEGPESGIGAVQEWDGNKDIGSGRLEIVEDTPLNVKIKLDFYSPMKAKNMAEYNLEPQADGTKMTWSMYGPNPFMGKVISVFINCEKMVGREFEKGLADLKTIVERA